MPLVVKDRVRQLSATSGTGTLTLGATVSGYQSFSAIGNGNTTYYTIYDPATEDWEVGIGTYTASGTTLSRDAVYASSNNNSLVSFAPNLKDVFCVYPASRAVYADSTNVVNLSSAVLTNATITNPTVSSGTINGATIGGTTPAAGTFTTLTSTGNATLGDSASADSHAINGVAAINANSASAALTVTQTGSGNAFVVEDSSSPDSSPFVVTSTGAVGIGGSPSVANKLQITDTITDATAYSGYWQMNAANPSGSGSQVALAVLAVPTTSWGSTGGVISGMFNLINQNAGTVAQVRGLSTQLNSTGGGTITNRFGFFDAGLTLTSGAVTNNYAFYANSTNIGATNNYGFWSGIADGTGRWNFYASGTAPNYFAGTVAIGTTTANGDLTVREDSAGAVTDVLTLENASASSINTGVAMYFIPNGGGKIRAASIQSIQSTAGNHADLRFFTANATTPAEAMRITNGRRVVLGGLAARTNLATASFSPALQIEGVVSDDRAMSITAQGGTTATASSLLILARTRGTVLGDNTAVVDGDSLGEIRFNGSDGTNIIQAAGIEARVAGTPGLNDMPGALLFKTTADGGTSSTERMRIDTSGNVLVTNNTGALGYGTGAGGTVTQITSRTTAVTLNRPTGSITMFTAAGSTTPASFTVNNSIVAATDTIVLSMRSGNTNVYNYQVNGVAAGSFVITFWTTGGVASDTPIINFAVIKGATA